MPTSHLKLSTVRINYTSCHKTHYHSVLIKLSLPLYAWGFMELDGYHIMDILRAIMRYVGWEMEVMPEVWTQMSYSCASSILRDEEHCFALCMYFSKHICPDEKCISFNQIRAKEAKCMMQLLSFLISELPKWKRLRNSVGAHLNRWELHLNV